MRLSVEYNHHCARPDDGEILTVRELIEILKECNPDSIIVIGTGMNDCEESIQRVFYNPNEKKPGAVGLFTEPEEPEDRTNAYGQKVSE